jgi:hypothetical protein
MTRKGTSTIAMLDVPRGGGNGLVSKPSHTLVPIVHIITKIYNRREGEQFTKEKRRGAGAKIRVRIGVWL